MRPICLCITLVMTVLLSGWLSPASADTRSVPDARDQPRAAFDIRRVHLENNGRGLTVTIRLRELSSRSSGFYIQFKDGRGAPHRINVTNRPGQGKRHAVRVQINAGDRFTRYRCSGLRQTWLHAKNTVRVFVPQDVYGCGGAAWDRFTVASVSRSEHQDRVYSGRHLPYR